MERMNDNGNGNLEHMRAAAAAWPDETIVQQLLHKHPARRHGLGPIRHALNQLHEENPERREDRSQRDACVNSAPDSMSSNGSLVRRATHVGHDRRCARCDRPVSSCGRGVGGSRWREVGERLVAMSNAS
jgi:hypothetical protein